VPASVIECISNAESRNTSSISTFSGNMLAEKYSKFRLRPSCTSRSSSAVAMPLPWKSSSTANAISAAPGISTKYEPTPMMRVSPLRRRQTIKVNAVTGSVLLQRRVTRSSEAAVGARKRRRRACGDKSSKSGASPASRHREGPGVRSLH
jgi:hypothetical protein